MYQNIVLYCASKLIHQSPRALWQDVAEKTPGNQTDNGNIVPIIQLTAHSLRFLVPKRVLFASGSSRKYSPIM